MDHLVTDKTEVLNAVFASACTKVSETSFFSERIQGERPTVDEDLVKDSLKQLVPYKSVITDGVCLLVVEVLARLITIISERSRKLGQVIDAWRKTDVAPIFKIVKKSQRTISWSASLLSFGKPCSKSFWNAFLAV